MRAIDYLQLGVEQYLRELSDRDWEQLAARVRLSDTSLQPNGGSSLWNAIANSKRWD